MKLEEWERGAGKARIEKREMHTDGRERNTHR